MPSPSERPGLGSILHDGGATFRVWAPHARWVRVAGSFNQWEPRTHELASEGNGYWSLEVDGVSVGDEYRYIIDDENHWRVDPRALDVTNSVGNGVVWASNYEWRVDDFQIPPWNELVVYELHADTFPPAPTSREQVFRAIEDKMTYLQDLGVNAIELLPLKEVPGDESWGYNPVHLFAIEDSYGGPDALKSLVDVAHGHGIAVFLDVVYQHFGPNDLEHSTWQFDRWHQHWEGQPMGGIYFYNDWRARTAVGSRPDYGRPEVRQLIRDNVMLWLEEYHIDGLRFDRTAGIRNVDGNDSVPPDDPTNLGGWGWNLLKWVNDEVNYRQPWKPMIAEDMRQNAMVTQPTSIGGLGFDSQWDESFHHTLRKAMVAPRDEDRDARAVAAAVANKFDHRDAFRRVIYTESHDEVGDYAGNPDGDQRVPEHIDRGNADSWHSRKRSTLGAAVVMTSPGIPMLFQGQEMLEWQQFNGSSPLDWSKVERFPGIVTMYRDLIRLRRNWFNQTRGLRGHHTNVFHVNDYDKVIAYHRYDQGGPGDDVVILANFANRAYDSYEIGLPRSGPWHVRLNSDWSGYSPDFSNHPSYSTWANAWGRDNLPCSGRIGIGPYTVVILSQ